MDVAEITMPSSDARVAMQEYRAALKQNPNADDRAVMAAYRALSQRRRVIDIIQAMRVAGVDERKRPRLAIVRADAERVWCHVDRDGGAVFSRVRSPNRNAAADTRVLMPALTFPPLGPNEWGFEGRALTPSIPPRFRPDAALSNYMILWEAEWQDVPRDPILLRHLGAHLYAVLAQWDLTAVEQAVLRPKALRR